jgi:biotin carboxylase
MVVKPVEGSASMGVNRLDDPAALRAWTLWAGLPTVTETFEVDEYVDGVLFNCDSLIQNGEIIWSAVCRNANPCLQYAAGHTIGAHTVPDDAPIAASIREFSRRVLAVLRPPDGAVHMEIFRTSTGELVFLEVAARPVGGDLRAIYLRCFGFDIDIAHFLLRAGEPYRLRLARSGELGGWFIHPRRRGRVTAIDLPRLASEHHIELSVQTGDLIEASSRHIADPPSAQVMLYGADVAAFTRDAELLAGATFYRTER